MKQLVGYVALVLCVVCVGAWAEAQDMAVAEDPMVFKNLDSNQDGLVSRAEAKSVIGLEQSFDTADANQDGQLDPNELANALPKPAAGK